MRFGRTLRTANRDLEILNRGVSLSKKNRLPENWLAQRVGRMGCAHFQPLLLPLVLALPYENQAKVQKWLPGFAGPGVPRGRARTRTHLGRAPGCLPGPLAGATPEQITHGIHSNLNNVAILNITT